MGSQNVLPLLSCLAMLRSPFCIEICFISFDKMQSATLRPIRMALLDFPPDFRLWTIDQFATGGTFLSYLYVLYS